MRSFRAFTLTLLVLCCIASDARATTVAQSSCRDAVAQAVTRYAAAAAKAAVRCNHLRSGGARPLDTDCSDVAQADSSGRLAAARSSSRIAILSACAGADSLLANYSACPAPAATADDGGPTRGIDNFGEVADCLLALADAEVGALTRSAEGNPATRILSPLRKCQDRLGKGADRLLLSYLAEGRRCERLADEEGDDGAYTCAGSDPRGRLRATAGHFSSGVSPQCGFAPDVLQKLQACSTDLAGLIDCAGSAGAERGAALIRDVYSMTEPATTTTTLGPGVTTTTMAPGTNCGDTSPQCDGACPAGLTCSGSGSSCHCVATGGGSCAPAIIHRSILSKFSTIRPSQTSLNAGWSGLAFDIDVPDGSRDILDVNCDSNCENCAVSLDTPAASPASNCRCTSSPATSCTVIDGSDPTSCGSIDPTCRCYFGAPLPISAGGNPACVAIRIRRDDGGTMNLRSGEWADAMHLAAVVYLGVDSTHPCPTCDGDPVPNDGVRGGVCSGGIGSTACDANGVHSTFGATSNDCLPATAANISGTGLLIDLNLSTSTVSLPATLPCDTPSDKMCHCRTCTGNSNLSCSSDAECAAIGAGTCTAGGGAGVRLNECDGFLCSASGQCTTGPVDSYCDGAVFPDGRGYVPCTTNADCTTGSAGSCSIEELRRCFPNPITYTGKPDPYGPTSVSAFCVAPTSNPAINLAAGLPGPGALLLTQDNKIFCKSDPSLPYEFPSGANCGDNSVTTTTLLPLPDCANATAPLCGGVCPNGQTCTAGSGTCSCTGLPLPACEDASAPVCGGICSGTGQVCTASGNTCACLVVTLPQCSGASAPVCGGLCPTGETCSSAGNTCECGAPGVPSCGSAIAPACAGFCDVGQACVSSGGGCGCLQLPVPTCNEATTPACAGTCSAGSTCGSAGGACQCTPLPIP